MKPGINYIGVGCGALVINDKKETLLLKRSSGSKNQSGFWSQPGGSVEFGEKAEDAVKREVTEELGIEIELINFLGYTDHIIKEENQHWVAFNYLARIKDGTPVNKEPKKIEEIRWFKLNNPPPNLTQTTAESIKYYLKSLES